MQLRASSPDRTCPPRLPNMGTGMKGERAFLARASAALEPRLETRRQRGGGPPGAGRGAGRQARARAHGPCSCSRGVCYRRRLKEVAEPREAEVQGRGVHAADGDALAATRRVTRR